MENHFMHRALSRLFPPPFSSCRFRNQPDVIETSNVISPNRFDTQPFSNQNKKLPTKSYKFSAIDSDGGGGGRSVKDSKIKTGYSSNGGWFSSELDGETETFFSLSSLSSDSFCRKVAEHRWRRCEHNNGNEMGRCSSELLAGRNGVSIEFGWNPAGNHREIAKRGGKAEMGRRRSDVTVSSAGMFHEVRRKTTRSHRLTNKRGRRAGTGMGPHPFVTEQKVQQISEFSASSTDHYNYPRIRREKNCRKLVTDHQKNVVGQVSSPLSRSLTTLYYADTRSSCWKSRKNGRRRRKTVSPETGTFSFAMDDRIKESYAMEKSSRDPYSDFRRSMVEMIIEKQIFGAEYLQGLLNCFLFLNSSLYHEVIIEVFTEVCETLFTN